MKKYIKTLLWIVPGACLFLILSGYGVILCMEHMGKNYILKKLSEETKWSFQAEKVIFSPLSKRKNLYISNVDGKKLRDNGKKEIFTFSAKNITLDINRIFFLNGDFTIQEADIGILTLQLEKDGRIYKREIRDICINDLCAGKEARLTFTTRLPFAGKGSFSPTFPVTGKGKFFFDPSFQLEKAALTVSGKEGKGIFSLALSAAKKEKDLWKLQATLSAKNLYHGEFFTFLQLEEWKKSSFHLESAALTLSALHKQKSDLIFKTLTGDLKVNTERFTLPKTLFSGKKNSNNISSALTFIQAMLQNLLSVEKKKLQNTEETKENRNIIRNTWDKIRQYQEKTLLMRKVLAGEEPIILQKSRLHISCKDSFCRILMCETKGNIPEKTVVRGLFTLPDTKIRHLEMENYILDLVLPVYFNGGTLLAPQTDESMSLRENWKRNKDIFSSGIKNLQQTFGRYISIDGKSLSDMPENEVIKKAQKKVKKHLDSIFKRLEKRKKKKEYRQREE